ncbi:external alternative NAD(P)H-ubiquinone oxidoreductase B3, mitochondrial-like [Macadamia integrifolia]|uniref:external alternative NAD(P)H-ubiquinone oxidoreductase B3, mitochondrial-like n=1 Tax=Macadamia integrifolia TaxID=60698 RepID=UPI001C4F9084|nr:external alternative NAD(P)H-ubiquinone oxidoreductase B3, mitochondrial-like [Macadamia integrifolia]
MNVFSFYQRASRAFHDYPSLSKLIVIFTVSSGGLVAYSDSKSYHGANNVNSSQMDFKKKRVVVLGTGWAGTSFLKNLDSSLYDVQVVSQRNYFAFTPLLPSVTCGTVEARSIVEPIRNIIGKKKEEIRFWEAECTRIDESNKKVHCRSVQEVGSDGKEEFVVDYDYLVIAIGARVNTFNTPGVEENCHFLKEVEDAQRIRRSVIDCFESASLPILSEEERKKVLHFVVVGGGPTGVEFAAELHDFVNEDLVKLYPKVKDLVKITLFEAGDHILNMFDKRITTFSEEKFARDGIDVKTGSMVTKVTDSAISTKEVKSGEVSSVPYGMVVWSTGIGTHPVIREFMNQIGQTNRRVLATDEWLRVEGCESTYALGDCATINQRKVMVFSTFYWCYFIYFYFSKNRLRLPNGKLAKLLIDEQLSDNFVSKYVVDVLSEINQIIFELEDNAYHMHRKFDLHGLVKSKKVIPPVQPQVEPEASTQVEGRPIVEQVMTTEREKIVDQVMKDINAVPVVHHHEFVLPHDFSDLNAPPKLLIMDFVRDADDEQFTPVHGKKSVNARNKQQSTGCFQLGREWSTKSLIAYSTCNCGQSGAPLLFEKLDIDLGNCDFMVQKLKILLWYKHLGQFAPLGGEQTAAQLPGDWVSIGHSSQWLWYSVYASKQVSWRTRSLVISDWTRRFIFGRDSSRI